MILDRYDTPEDVAKAMVGCIVEPVMGPIADFAVGGGNLLRVAAKQWPHLELIGTDVDQNTIRRLRKLNPSWILGQADLLSSRSRSCCRALNDRKGGGVGIILMNPPFSCRGARRVKVHAFNRVMECSTATAFIIYATMYLRLGGQLVAVMPSGSLDCDRDRDAWRFLDGRFNLNIFAKFGRDIFTGASVRTVVVHLASPPERVAVSKERNPQVGQYQVQVASRNLRVEMVRGQLAMHSIVLSSNGIGVPLVHTTKLRGGKLESGLEKVINFRWIIRGPAVLLPRVGEPGRDKVALLGSGLPVALSDCVIALLCRDLNTAARIRRKLVKDWHFISQLYRGTCARYITLDALSNALSSLGIDVVPGDQRKIWVNTGIDL